MGNMRILMSEEDFNAYEKTYHFGLYCTKAIYDDPTWGSGSAPFYVVYFEHMTANGLYQLGMDMQYWRSLDKNGHLLRSDTQPNNPDRVIVRKPQPKEPTNVMDADELRDIQLETAARDFEDRMNAHFENRHEE